MTEHFTSEERTILARYFTNVDRPVFALVNLPEVVKAALFARYSRSPKSLRRLFLDEFLNDNTTAEEAPHAVGIARAERLFDRVLTEFGDDSVAQLGGVHLACEGVSNISTKLLEWGRLMAYLEQSTRYVPYTDRPDGKWKYYLPEEIDSPDLQNRCRSVLDSAFQTYSSWLEPLMTFYSQTYPKSPSDTEAVYRASIRSKALDTLRGLLPAATKSNVGLFGAAQAYEQLLLRLRATPLTEARVLADAILSELNQVIPAFLKRVELPNRGGAWVRYLSDTHTRTKEVAQTIAFDSEGGPNDVTLTEYDPEGETKVVAAALYSVSRLSDAELLEHARRMTVEQRHAVLSAYIGDRTNRRHKPGRAFERTSYRFDIVSDYGAFRDLQRHRMLTLEWQLLSCGHGYITPEAIKEVGALEEWRRAMNDAAQLYEAVATAVSPEVAQYVVPMAYRIRFYMHFNAREAMHILELRTTPQGHPSYRRICQEMHRLITTEAGHVAVGAAMKFVNFESVGLERLESERLGEKKRNALNQTLESS